MHSSSLLKQLSRTVGMPTEVEIADGQLLKSFLTTDDQAAFSCLFRRHAPAIYRSALRIVRDRHRAEDVVQASFLVLCQQASSIRQEQSLAGWLHRVAVRIALKLQSEFPAFDSISLTQFPESPEFARRTNELEQQALLEVELSRLPAKYQTPLIMHYLEGKPPAVLASELQLTYGAVLVRLSRGRNMLRARCLRKDGSAPTAHSYLLALGSIEPASAIPGTLTQTTLDTVRLLRLGGGVTSPISHHLAVQLAAGMSQAMATTRTKLVLGLAKSLVAAATCVCLFFASGVAKEVENADVMLDIQPGVTPAGPVKTNDGLTLNLKGSVREEGTGLPVQGAILELRTTPVWKGSERELLSIKTDKNGKFNQLLPAGNYRVCNLLPPVSFTNVAGIQQNRSFVLNESHPTHSMHFLVRKGTVWPVSLGGEESKRPYQPVLLAHSKTGGAECFRSVNGAGMFGLTLPYDAGSVMIRVDRPAPGIEYPLLDLDWEDGFKPGAVRSILKSKTIAGQYQLIDEGRKSATVTTKGPVQPKLFEGGQMLIFLMPQARRIETADLAGRVVDAAGKAVCHATVSLHFKFMDGSLPKDVFRTARTDAEGSYRFIEVAKWYESGKPTTINLSVTASRFAGVDLPPFRFIPPANNTQTVDIVRLQPGKIIRGLVLQSNGKPAVGVWVQPTDSSATSKQSAKTDQTGRFTIRDVPAGRNSLSFEFGDIHQTGSYIADANPTPVVVNLKALSE